MENKDIKYIDWGTIEYGEALKKQEEMFHKAIEKKLAGQTVENRMIVCEHPHVYTLGKSGKENNMLLSEAALKAMNVPLFHINRGGDITYHGPGQLVSYPIFDIDQFGLGLKDYIDHIEQAVIDVCATYGIEAGRLHGATGVWLEPDTRRARKICAIGVQSSHYVTMHGLALNVNTDMSYFHNINPCGFVDKGVTSIAIECGRHIDMAEVKERLYKAFRDNFLK